MSTTDYSNRAELDKALKIYLEAMSRFVIDILGTQSTKKVLPHLSGSDIRTDLEIKDIATLITERWKPYFRKEFKIEDGYYPNRFYDAPSVASLIVEGRNRVSHKRLRELDSRFTQAQLFFIAEILGKINALDAQREVETIRDKLLDDAEKESNKKLSKQFLDNAIKLDEKRKELEKLSKQLAEAELQVDDKERQRKKLDRQLKDAKGRTDKLKTELARVKKRLEKSEAAQADYKKRLETAQKELKETEEHLAQVQTENKQEVEATRDELLDPAADRTLSNTIAHILEHEQHLTEANEASTKQHVILPILRALGWDDALASMEVLPEYAVVNGGSVDYALKVGDKLALFLECKRWNEPLERHEDQIINYAFQAGVRVAALTNGKIWRFYFSWIDGKPVNERIFCKIDIIEDWEDAISNLEKYLLVSNVASGEAEEAAEIALKEKADTSKPRPIDSKEDVSNVTDSQPTTKQSVARSKFSGEWTVERIRNLVSEKIRDYHEANFSEERCNVFYRTVAEAQNLIKTMDWRLKSKFYEKSCRFWLTDKGVTQVKSVFGVHLQYNPFTLHVRLMKKDAEDLKRQCGCDFYSVSKNKSADYVYYHIRDDITELLPVLEFAYKKHSGS